MLDSLITVMKGMIEDWVAKPFIWLAILLANIEQ